MSIDISHITLPDDFNRISDFYIPENDPMSGILYPNAVDLYGQVEYTDIVQFMLGEAKKKPEDVLEFSLELRHEDTKIILRGHSIKSVEGKVFIFRRLPSYIPNITELGMPENIVELLLHTRMNTGGLIIIAGETGQGKSTTAAASIAYRLKHYGSFCLTIEDPVELPLQGFYENEQGKRGVCFQTNVVAEGVPEAIKSSMRCYPSVSNSILFLGETRDAEMASEVIRVAANGHLVITTMHGGDLMTSLKRFVSLASSKVGANPDEVKSIFSSVFRLLIHQRMEVSPSTGKRKLVPNVLFSPGSNSSIASRLRTGGLELLSTDIQTQNMTLNKGGSIANL